MKNPGPPDDHNQSKYAPYESPIEQAFGERIKPLLHPRTAFHVQKKVKPYRVDLAASFNDEHVGIECDGKHFHDFKTDRCRDMAIMSNRGWRMMFRFRGGDIIHSPESCIALMRLFAPHLFDPAAYIPPVREMILELSCLMPHQYHRMVCRVSVGLHEINVLKRSDIHQRAVEWIGCTPDRNRIFAEFKTPGWFPPDGMIPAEPTIDEQLAGMHQAMRDNGYDDVPAHA